MCLAYIYHISSLLLQGLHQFLAKSISMGEGFHMDYPLMCLVQFLDQ